MNMLDTKSNKVRKARLFSLYSMFFLIYFSFSCKLIAQITIRVNNVPEYFTPLLDTLYVTGTFNDWNPGDTDYVLEQDFDGTYFLLLEGVDGAEFEFKFTRGDWDRVETLAGGGFLPNRTAIFESGLEINCDVENWQDQIGTHTISGTVFQLDYNFEMPELNRDRRIWIYLPPDYYTSTNSYPVVYMHDGQNVFDYASSFAGEWDVDGSMQNIIANGHTAAIIVGIANGELDRIDEYSAWTHPTYGGGDGDLYASFVVNTLKPYIDENYRTKSDRLNTAVGGSSLGGLISYYMVLEYDEIFSKALVYSPSFWFDDSVNTFTNEYENTLPIKIYITAGATEDVDMVPDINTITDALFLKGFSEEEILTVIRPDGAHSEWFWKREYDDGFLWLFDSLLPLTIDKGNISTNYFYDMQNNVMHTDFDKSGQYFISDIQGVKRQSGTITEQINCNYLNTGVYFCTFVIENQFSTVKMIVK
jgi:predicted alpha/beta superfamily hydrolase